MTINTTGLNNINLDDDDNFDGDDPETIIYVRLTVQCNRYKQRKVFKKEIWKILMAAGWHPTRLVCVKGRKKRKRTVFDWRKAVKMLLVYVKNK